MIAVRSLDELELGSSVWARAGGFWRRVRVLGHNRTTVRVSYFINAGRLASPSLKIRDLPLDRFRLDPPPGIYGIVLVPAPPARSDKR